MIRKSLLICCSALFAYGCASSGGRVSEPERRAYASARAALPDDPAGAALQLESLLRQWPQGALADDAAELLADLAAQRGDREGELRWLESLLRNQPRGDRSDAARLRLATLQFGAENTLEAARVMASIRYSRLTPEEELAAYQLQAKLAEDRVDRIVWLSRARGTQPDPELQRRIDAEIDQWLVIFSVEDLERLASALVRDVPAGRVQLQLAARALSLGDREGGERALARAEALQLTESDAQLLDRLKLRFGQREAASTATTLPTFAEALENGIPDTAGATGAIGVVLPLSGPFQRFGEEGLRGILLATQIFNQAADRLPDVASSGALDRLSSESARGPLAVKLAMPARRLDVLRVVVRDSAGEPERAAAAVRELANEGVVAIVGPLLSGPAEAAAAVAEELQVPLLTLTSREEVPRDRPYVFRVRTTPNDEVRFLVDYAIDELKAERFAILHPADGYGRGMRDRFWERVDERGGGVVGVSSYDPTSTDFAGPIRRMIGYELLTAREVEALKERDELLKRARRLAPEEAAEVREAAYEILGPEGDPLPPRVDFDVVFIPDSHEKVVLIAPQLAFHEVTGVRLLGPEGWNHPDLVKIARSHVRGAVITTPFHRESHFAPVTRFVQAYETTYDAEPESLAAQAYDAANLILIQLLRGRDSRGSLRDGMLGTEGYPGASGVITVLPDGNALKRPFLLGVRRGEFVPLD